MGKAKDVVQLAHGRINEGDLDGFVDLLSPRVRWQDVPEIPGSRLYQGPDEVRQWAENLRDVSEDLQLNVWDIQERGNAVLVETEANMTGSRSGAEVGWRFWTVWRVREDLIAYHHGYSVKADALADFESAEG